MMCCYSYCVLCFVLGSYFLFQSVTAGVGLTLFKKENRMPQTLKKNQESLDLIKYI
jgi:hypothetical protein